MPSVCVYSFEATGERRIAQRCAGLLSSVERKRAAQMREGLPRDEFVTGRAVLRVLLGRELGVAPAEVALEHGPRGKPAVQGVFFNLSHAHGQIVLAVSRTVEVGVDVEQVGDTADLLTVAQDHFSTPELDFVERAADSARAFCRVWTRKEAVLKALGCGLTDELGSFNALESPVRLRDRDVFVQDLDAGPATAGALAGLDKAFEFTVERLTALEIGTLLAR